MRRSCDSDLWHLRCLPPFAYTVLAAWHALSHEFFGIPVMLHRLVQIRLSLFEALSDFVVHIIFFFLPADLLTQEPIT